MNNFIEKIKPNFLDKNNKISASKLLWFFRKNPTEKQQLLELTPNCIGDENFMERIFWLENNLDDYLECVNPNCTNNLHNITRWENKKTQTKWTKSNHRLACSNECKHQLHSFRNDEVHARRVEIWLEKYGVEHSSRLDTNLFKLDNPMKKMECIEKAKMTCIEKYGVDNPSKNPEVIAKIKEKANRSFEEQMEINNKRELTCLQKYGKSHISKLPETQDKIKKTYLEKYGVEHNSQVPEIFEQMNKNGYTSKDYIFPSGKIVRIRGFENKALDDLLEKL